jgi:hypothetical protein
MRLIHLVLAIFFLAMIMAIARDEVGRVALVVFFTGLGEFVFGLIAIMTLFQTVGAIGEANRPLAYAQAVVATAVVLVVATVTMNALLYAGLSILQRVVD